MTNQQPNENEKPKRVYKVHPDSIGRRNYFQFHPDILTGDLTEDSPDSEFGAMRVVRPSKKSSK